MKKTFCYFKTSPKIIRLAVTQAEMPSRPIPKSFVGSALMAHILASKYGYYLPLYRQSQMFENEPRH